MPIDVRPVFSSDIFTQQRFGGISRYYVELRASLSAMGVPSWVAAPVWRTEGLRSSDGVRGLQVPLSFERKGVGAAARFAGLLRERQLLARLSRTPGGVLLHRTNYSARSAPGRIPIVDTVYDMIIEDNPHLFDSQAERSHRKRTAIERSDLVISISDYTRERLLAHFDVEPTKVVTVPLGVRRYDADLQLFGQLINQRPFLLYVGNRPAYKNFERFLRAATETLNSHPELGVVLFGGGCATEAELNRLAELGLSRRVRFHAGGDAQLAAHYYSAEMLVYPSLDEGFGLPPLEAAAHGCPVVSARAGAMPEVLGDNVTYFDPLSEESMVEAIDSLLATSRGDRASRVNTSVPKWLERYTWEATASATLEAYSSLFP